jgi:hypothetical protein
MKQAIFSLSTINVTRYLFKVNQAIFSGSRETASTLITLRESRELIRKARNMLFLAGAVKPQVH